MRHYEVQTWTMMQGWINCWSIDDVPEVFSTKTEAEDALRFHLRDLRAAWERGEIEDEPTPEDYIIVEVAQ